MIYPTALKYGDKIGFFSPSFPATAFASIRFARAKTYLESKGFELVAGSLTGKTQGYRSGSIQERADEFNKLVRDPSVRCVMTTIGGYNTNSILPYIDYQALKLDPKIIIGYSDATALLLAIYAKTGLTTFYGPALVASFGEYPPLVDQTYQSFIDLCAKYRDSYQYTMPEFWTDIRIEWEEQTAAKPVYSNEWHFLGKGKISGRLIGGNLNTMSGIWGSEYMPQIQEGDILLLEDSLLDINEVERSFAHLKANNVFAKVSAIILGKHELFNDKGTGLTPLDVLLEVMNEQTVPIFYGFDSCHSHPMLVTPIGVNATIDFDKYTFCLSSPWLRT